MDAQNNITEVSKTSQFGLSQSIRGLAVVGITALVFVAWGIRLFDYLGYGACPIEFKPTSSFLTPNSTS